VGVAILSQICDSGRVFGTARHRVPPFLAESGRITWLFRITGLTGPLPGGGWRVHTVLRPGAFQPNGAAL
jgi:hypothetical protein